MKIVRFDSYWLSFSIHLDTSVDVHTKLQPFVLLSMMVWSYHIRSIFLILCNEGRGPTLCIWLLYSNPQYLMLLTFVHAALQEDAVELLDCGCVQSESRKLPLTSVRFLACCMLSWGSTVTKSVTGIYRF